MEDMVNDTLEQDDDLELEEEADEEVEKIIFEITNGKLGEAGKPANTALPSKKVRVFAEDGCSLILF